MQQNLKISIYLIFLMSTAANSEIIYGINANNTAVISFDTSNGDTEVVKSLSFYSQGQVVYNPISDNIYILDGGTKKIKDYDLQNNSTADITISNDTDQVQSLIGYKKNGTLLVKTDDFGESASVAKRFATISTDGNLTRAGSPLMTGSEYPQGSAHYNENLDTILRYLTILSKGFQQPTYLQLRALV